MSAWINQIFRAGQVNEGNVVRRSMHDVAKYASARELEKAVRDKGYHMALIGQQYVILCNPAGAMQIIC
jgi:hypothetical protein